MTSVVITYVLGEYHLFIDRVTLLDDATYQCQVGPSGDDPALVSAAVLSVISEYPM